MHQRQTLSVWLPTFLFAHAKTACHAFDNVEPCDERLVLESVCLCGFMGLEFGRQYFGNIWPIQIQTPLI